MFYVIENGDELFICTEIDEMNPEDFIKSKESNGGTGLRVVGKSQTEQEAMLLAEKLCQ